MSDADILQEIPPDVLSEFLKIMVKYFPGSIHGHAFISTLLKWKKMKPELPIEILSPNGDPRLGIVFYFILDDSFIGSTYAHDEKAVENLQEALILTKKLPYLDKRMTKFACTNDLSLKSLSKLLATPEWQVMGTTKIPTVTLWMPSYKASQIDVRIPEGVEVRDLRKADAKLIDKYWEFHFPGSEKLLELMIELNLGLGVFRGDSLLSWALLWYYGGIGSVDTVKEERGKGYAKAVVGALTKKMGQLQMDVNLDVVVENEKAANLFKSLGFSIGCPATWVSRC